MLRFRLHFVVLALLFASSTAFTPHTRYKPKYSRRIHGSNPLVLAATTPPSDNKVNDKAVGSPVNEYRNAVTRFLSQFLPSQSFKEEITEVVDQPEVDWNAPKISKSPLTTLAELLDGELLEKEWFVTGKVNASFFSNDFEFQDPDVKVKGIQDYSRGVVRLFDQATSRAEIISTVVNNATANTITVTWRLSGKVNVGPAGLVIKPYICFTDFIVDEQTGLIRFQEDRFDLPGWDIILSALFPFLIGVVTAPPAPPVSPRR